MELVTYYRLWLARTAAGVLLPAEAREAVEGDLTEEGLHPGTMAYLIALVGVSLHVHCEPYRDDGARLGVVAAFILGLLVLWAVQAAAWTGEPPLELYRDPVSRAALVLWGASHLTSAAAAGLVVGHAPGIPPFASVARWHAAVALAAVAWWSAPAGPYSVAAAVLVLGATWLSATRRSRESVRSPR